MMLKIDIKKIANLKNLDKKKLILFVTGFVVLILVLTLISKARRLSGELTHKDVIIKKMQEQAEHLTQEREVVEREKEELETDTLSYLQLNTSLGEDKKRLKSAVEKTKDILEDKEVELEKLRQDLKRYEEQISKQGSEYKSKFEDELQDLKDTIDKLEDTLQRERGIYQYNLAVSYTKANLFDEAVEAYEKSLEMDPDNPEAHYNLGLLYVNFKEYPERAVKHYRRYLELSPDAIDREEVVEWVKILETRMGY